jgi:SAM-dependent methyltransferase
MSRAMLPVSDRQFWEGQALDYPLPFERETAARSLPVLEILEQHGITIKGSSILDIGSGTGVFALPMALRGARVTALDISETMLLRLSEEARQHSHAPITTVRSSWADLDIAASGFERAFDIVFCGFSTAAESEEDIAKMERCARHWCVFTASGKVRRSPLCGQILRKIRAPINPRPDIRNIRRRLAGMGRSAQYASFTKTANSRKSQAEIIRLVTTRMAAAGRKSNPDRIASVIRLLREEQRNTSDFIVCRSEIDIGVLVWRANEN